MELHINWKIEIQNAEIFREKDKPSFRCYSNDELILAYHEIMENQSYYCGKLALVKGGKLRYIFDSKRSLGSCFLDGEYIFLSSDEPANFSESATNDSLFKLNMSGDLLWSFPLQGLFSSRPIITDKFILLTSFCYRSNKSHFIKLDKNSGAVLFKQPLSDFAYSQHLTMGKQTILLSYHKPRIEIRDFDGKLVKEHLPDALGDPPFSQKHKGSLFGAINCSIQSLDEDLNVKWKYKPTRGWVKNAPVIDEAGNIYSFMNYKRVVSLNQEGKENWIYPISNHGDIALVLSNDNILILARRLTDKNPSEEQLETYFEMLSQNGEKVFEGTLPGGLVSVIESNKSLFMLVQNMRANERGFSTYR
jgi:outer membrane protein assembly factor BamB